jgi:hypothetical protein
VKAQTRHSSLLTRKVLIHLLLKSWQETVLSVSEEQREEMVKESPWLVVVEP